MTQKHDRKDLFESSALNALTDFLGDSEAQSNEEIIAELKAEGIAIDNLISKVESLVASNIEETKRGWINEAHKLLKHKQAKLNSINVEIPSFEELKAKVRQIISDDPEFANAYFSNFTELSEDDLKTIYIDFQKLKKIDEEQGSEDE
jgi:hypothetical protein